MKVRSTCSGWNSAVALAISLLVWAPLVPTVFADSRADLRAKRPWKVRVRNTMLYGQKVTVSAWKSMDRDGETRHGMVELVSGTFYSSKLISGNVANIEVVHEDGNSLQATITRTLDGVCQTVFDLDDERITVEFTKDWVRETHTRYEDGTTLILYGALNLFTGGPPNEYPFEGFTEVTVLVDDQLRFSMVSETPIPLHAIQAAASDVGWVPGLIFPTGGENNLSVVAAVGIGIGVALLYLLVDCLFLGWWCELIPEVRPYQLQHRLQPPHIRLARFEPGSGVYCVAA